MTLSRLCAASSHAAHLGSLATKRSPHFLATQQKANARECSGAPACSGGRRRALLRHSTPGCPQLHCSLLLPQVPPHWRGWHSATPHLSQAPQCHTTPLPGTSTPTVQHMGSTPLTGKSQAASMLALHIPTLCNPLQQAPGFVEPLHFESMKPEL